MRRAKTAALTPAVLFSRPWEIQLTAPEASLQPFYLLISH